MTPDQHRTAKYVIAWLAKAEDPDNPDYPVGGPISDPREDDL